MSSNTSLDIAVLTISDTRKQETDKSGDLLSQRIEKAGHYLAARDIIKDDKYLIRARVAQWIADPKIQAVITTGGTGFTGRDSTPEAVSVLFDILIEGFGELFRQLSYQEVGSSTIQSRALAGYANNTLVFSLPGSTNACKTAWDHILDEQLNSLHRPCNFASLITQGHHPHG